MTYGYARVSSKEQNLDRQIKALTEAGVDEIITDKSSGKDFKRKGYTELLEKLQKGDLVVVLSLDRLGRNYVDLKDEWNKITNTIGADIRVLDMPILDTSRGAQSLDGKFIADLVMQILSYVAQKERENTRRRQAEGIAAARARGVQLGGVKRIHIPDEMIERVKRKEITVVAACKELGISKTSWYNEMKAGESDGN